MTENHPSPDGRISTIVDPQNFHDHRPVERIPTIVDQPNEVRRGDDAGRQSPRPSTKTRVVATGTGGE